MVQIDAQLTGADLICGEWQAAPEEWFHAVNPTTGALSRTAFAESTPDQIRLASHGAAQAHILLSRTSPESLAAALEGIASAIEGTHEPLVNLAAWETGLAVGRLESELSRASAQFRMFERAVADGTYLDAAIDTAVVRGGRVVTPDVRRIATPIGPVAVFGASNFPFAFGALGGDVAAALACGCPVVIKGHPSHPGVAELSTRLLRNAIAQFDLPSSTVSLVQGRAVRVGMALAAEDDIAAVAFTGSLAGGRTLFDVASRRRKPIPVFAEMGSLNPVFVGPGVLKDRGSGFVDELVASAMVGAGQLCTKPGAVFVPKAELPLLLSTLVPRLSTERPVYLLSEGIRHAFSSGAAALRGTDGVRTVVLGVEPTDERQSQVCAVLADVRTFTDEGLLRSECFGPLMLIVAYESDEDLRSLASSIEGSLTVSLYFCDGAMPNVLSVLPVLRERAGRIVFNDMPTGVRVSPAMYHGGPYPATTMPEHTSVGASSMRRFLRPVCYQAAPQSVLPIGLRDSNPLGIWRLVDGRWTSAPIAEGAV